MFSAKLTGTCGSNQGDACKQTKRLWISDSHVDDADAESTVSGVHRLAEATEVADQGVMLCEKAVIIRCCCVQGWVRLGWGAELKAEA